MTAIPVFPAIDMVLTRGIHHGHFQFGDGPAIVLHIRQCQQRHIDESALIGNQEIREIPEEIASAIGSQGIGLHLQPHNRALLFRADLDGVIGGDGGVLYQLLRLVHQVAIAHGRCVRGVVQTSCRQLQMRIRHGNVLAVHPASAADARAVNALRRDIAAGDGDVMRGNILPAADARAALDAGSDHIAAVNIDLAAPPLIAAADAGSLCAALARHRGPGSRQHIQRALAAVLLNGRASGRALQRAVPASEVQIGRGLVVDLDGRRLGAGTHLDVQAVNENMRRGLWPLDLDLPFPAPLVAQLLRHRRVEIIASAVSNGKVRRPVVQIDELIILGDCIHRPARRRNSRRQQRQQHTADKQQRK